MVDALMTGTPNWIDQLSQWYDVEADTHRLVNELKRRFLGMLDLQRGVTVQPPFFAQQLRRNLRNWPPPRLSRAIQELAALEHALKSGGTTGISSKAGDYNALQLYLAGILN